MKGRFQGDIEKYGLTHRNYEISFHSEGLAIFVDVEGQGTCIFPGMDTFLDSWLFEGIAKSHSRVRKFTDFETSRYFSLNEVAEFFGVHKATAARWVDRGKLPIHHRIKPRGDLRFAREDVMELYAGMKNGY